MTSKWKVILKVILNSHFEKKKIIFNCHFDIILAILLTSFWQSKWLVKTTFPFWHHFGLKTCENDIFENVRKWHLIPKRVINDFLKTSWKWLFFENVILNIFWSENDRKRLKMIILESFIPIFIILIGHFQSTKSHFGSKMTYPSDITHRIIDI